MGPTVLIERFRPVEADVSGMTAKGRMVGTLAIVLAGLAVVLAVVGLYGVLAYSVGQRRREFRVRLLSELRHQRYCPWFFERHS
jgi:hypothetical protein